jgi:hypothetical protein
MWCGASHAMIAAQHEEEGCLINKDTCDNHHNISEGFYHHLGHWDSYGTFWVWDRCNIPLSCLDHNGAL